MNCHAALLTQEALLHISGPDALKFLQGQVTCDTRLLDTGTALQGAYCTPQGRVVCDFLLLQLGEDHVALRLRRGIRRQTAAVLGKYIIFSKAELEAGRDDWQPFAIWGEKASDLVAALCGNAPTKRLEATTVNGICLVQMDDAGEQFEGCIDSSLHDPLPPALAATFPSGDENAWQALQILSGLGRIESATQELFIPQMLNYDLTGHISFNKGCYTGQEVVARLHYRGTPKRRMYLVNFDDGDQVRASAEIYRPGSSQSVGNLVNCAPAAGGGTVALVVCTTEAADGELHLGSPEGPQIYLDLPPYSLEKG